MAVQNAVIFTLGTRGDVQPYIYLAQALNKTGFKACVATHPCWRNLVEQSGVDFAPIGPDIDISYEAAVIRSKAALWLLGAVQTMNFVFKIIERSSDQIYTLCRNADLVVSSHSHAGAIEAMKCQKPFVSVTLQPEAIAQVKKPQKKGFGKLLGRLAGAVINPMMTGPYNKILKKYGLAPVRTIEGIMSPTLNLIPISSYLVPQNPYWETKNKVVGYWYDDTETFKPSDAFVQFLNAGDKPVIVALGAMAFESKEEVKKLDILVKSFQKTGMRAVFQGFDKTLEKYALPETMMKVGSIPHSWLFAQGYCVVHHGGLGTTASALLAGRPSIVIPHVLDQFLWAEKIFQLHAGVKPIKAGDLSEPLLVEAIQNLQTQYAHIQKDTASIAEKMKAENGLNKAVTLIQQALKESERE